VQAGQIQAINLDEKSDTRHEHTHDYRPNQKPIRFSIKMKRNSPNLRFQLHSPLFPTLFLRFDLLPSYPQPILVLSNSRFPLVLRLARTRLHFSKFRFELSELGGEVI
jgi:hypothetical protein